MTDEKKLCPDKGFCHHTCEAACFRVQYCAPISGVYLHDKWPQTVENRHRRADYSLPLTDLQVEFLISQMRMRGWNKSADKLQEQNKKVS